MGRNLINSFLENDKDITSSQATEFFPEILNKVIDSVTGDDLSFLTEERFENAIDENFVKPTWSDIQRNYPATSTFTKDLYDEIGGGLPQALIDNPDAYENSCAIRMSKALNYSGVFLPKAPSKGGNIRGKDRRNYWIRIKDLKKYLLDNLKKPTVDKKGGVGVVENFKNKHGIIVFDVSGGNNAGGHFTLWDGIDLLYVGAETPEHNDPTNESMYYFSMNYMQGTVNVKTTRIRLWELK